MGSLGANPRPNNPGRQKSPQISRVGKGKLISVTPQISLKHKIGTKKSHQIPKEDCIKILLRLQAWTLHVTTCRRTSYSQGSTDRHLTLLCSHILNFTATIFLFNNY